MVISLSVRGYISDGDGNKLSTKQQQCFNESNILHPIHPHHHPSPPLPPPPHPHSRPPTLLSLHSYLPPPASISSPSSCASPLAQWPHLPRLHTPRLNLHRDDVSCGDADIIHPCIPCCHNPKGGYIVSLLDLWHDLPSYNAFGSIFGNILLST